MTSFTPNDLRKGMAQLRRPLRLTRLGMLAETVVQSFWPLMTVLLLALSSLMLGLQDLVAVEAVWTAAGVGLLALLGAVIYAFRRFRMPSKTDAMARLDDSLPGRPIQAMMDQTNPISVVA